MKECLRLDPIVNIIRQNTKMNTTNKTNTKNNSNKNNIKTEIIDSQKKKIQQLPNLEE